MSGQTWHKVYLPILDDCIKNNKEICINEYDKVFIKISTYEVVEGGCGGGCNVEYDAVSLTGYIRFDTEDWEYYDGEINAWYHFCQCSGGFSDNNDDEEYSDFLFKLNMENTHYHVFVPKTFKYLEE